MPSFCSVPFLHRAAIMMVDARLECIPNLESLINDLRRRLNEVASDLEPLFNICAAEARFGASVIESDLHHLSPRDQILEIGGGVLLLACYLRKEGYAVTTVEPAGSGFSHFFRLRKIVLDYASDGGFKPAFFMMPAEALEFVTKFDYAFSINVMEHVNDVALVLRRVLSAIKRGGCYHFLCPNYLFPYEPHFNIPTLFSKALTQCLFGKKIRSSKRVADPEGLWMSLNWISVPYVRYICHNEGVEPVFDRAVSYRFIKRALHDNDFQRRRGSLILRMLRAVDRLSMTRLTLLVPVICQPAMDCLIVRES